MSASQEAQRRGAWAGEITAQLEASAQVLRETAGSAETLAIMAGLIADALGSGHKLLLCGNGGSAADAQHVATELVARYKRERPALPAIALGTDVTLLTAMSNDYSFEHVFARQIEALGVAGDVLWAFSTSGNSANVLAAARAARIRNMAVIGFTGANGGKLRDVVDHCLCVPSSETPRIQEAHIAAAHVICDLVEASLAG
ncbi:MAG TPA: D-sedoheptulose 7-phosphate isomerase [Chloroflexota bacterium]|nr:D-sedoheptulose 7-phosphate isomerase [Chloroflexota bacterium]